MCPPVGVFFQSALGEIACVTQCLQLGDVAVGRHSFLVVHLKRVQECLLSVAGWRTPFIVVSLLHRPRESKLPEVPSSTNAPTGLNFETIVLVCK